MIFVSTGGARNQTAAATAGDLLGCGIPAVELSGGLYFEDYEAQLIGLRRQLMLQVHNYFPPPKHPFVLNLASADPGILERTLQHVRTAVRLAVSLERPIYSFHAGFRIDPQVTDLGRPLGAQVLRDRASALLQFQEMVLLLAEESRREGSTLLIENNVLAPFNLAKFGEDPLLLTHPEEIAAFMSGMPANVGLLLDVAHLKVSANTLGFDLHAAHHQLEPFIRGYHLSDNDGTADSNDALTENSWFWTVINPNLDYYTLEVYKSPVELVQQYELVKRKLGREVAK